MAENSIRSTGSNNYVSKPFAFKQRDINAQPKELIHMLQPQHLQDPAPKQSCHRAKRVALSSQLASAGTSLPTTCSHFNKRSNPFTSSQRHEAVLSLERATDRG
jgi:hypothetical protein